MKSKGGGTLSRIDKQNTFKIFKANLSMDVLHKFFYSAIISHAKLIAIVIDTPDGEKMEIIRSKCFKSQLQFYDKHYDEHLRLNTAPCICVKAIAQADEFRDLTRLMRE